MTSYVYVRDDGFLTVFSPYEAKHALKVFPGREWDATRKAWRIPAEHLDYVEASLARFGRVHVSPDPRCRPPRERHAWIAEALDAVGPAHRRRLYRVLAAALHPDHGGDAEAMKQLNAVVEERQIA